MVFDYLTSVRGPRRAGDTYGSAGGKTKAQRRGVLFVGRRSGLRNRAFGWSVGTFGSPPAKMFRRAEKAKHVSGKHSSSQTVRSCPSCAVYVRESDLQERERQELPVPGQSPPGCALSLSLQSWGNRAGIASIQREEWRSLGKIFMDEIFSLGLRAIFTELFRSQTLRTRDPL